MQKKASGLHTAVLENYLFYVIDLRSSYRILKKLRSKPATKLTSTRKAIGCLASDTDRQRARWAEYFKRPDTRDPPSWHLPTNGLRGADAYSLIYEVMSFFDKVNETVARLKDGKAGGGCNIIAELLMLILPQDQDKYFGLPDETVESVPVCGDDVETLEV